MTIFKTNMIVYLYLIVFLAFPKNIFEIFRGGEIIELRRWLRKTAEIATETIDANNTMISNLDEVKDQGKVMDNIQNNDHDNTPDEIITNLHP